MTLTKSQSMMLGCWHLTIAFSIFTISSFRSTTKTSWKRSEFKLEMHQKPIVGRLCHRPCSWIGGGV